MVPYPPGASKNIGLGRTSFISVVELITQNKKRRVIFMESSRGPPQFLKKGSENAWANENLSCGFPSIPGIAPSVAPRILVFFRIAQVVRHHSENGISHSENYFLNSESCSENTLPELRDWPFHSESVFPENGVVPRFPIHGELRACQEASQRPKSTILFKIITRI